jgi:hypothetical protein
MTDEFTGQAIAELHPMMKLIEMSDHDAAQLKDV